MDIVEERAADFDEGGEPLAIEDLSVFEELRFENLQFEYHTRAPVYRNASFSVRKGEKIAILGASGSGKTTLLKTISGLYQPTSGTAYLNGEALSNWYRLRQASILMQRSDILFSGSLLEALQNGRTDVTEKQIWALLERLKLRDLIETQPGGLNTSIQSDNTHFSTGQLQRMLVIRTILSGRPLLLFKTSA